MPRLNSGNELLKYLTTVYKYTAKSGGASTTTAEAITVDMADTDLTSGTELWSMPARLTHAAVAEPFGSPCGGTTAPRIGATSAPRLPNATFAVQLGSAPANAFCVLLTATTSNPPAYSCYS